MANKQYTIIGSWLFLIGIVTAFIIGIYQAVTLEQGGNFFESTTGGWSAWGLALLGVLVGILTFLGEGTITRQEIPRFLMAGIALVVMGGIFEGWHINLTPFLGSILSGLSVSLSIFVAPAVGIIAIKTIWDVGKDR